MDLVFGTISACSRLAGFGLWDHPCGLGAMGHGCSHGIHFLMSWTWCCSPRAAALVWTMLESWAGCLFVSGEVTRARVWLWGSKRMVRGKAFKLGSASASPKASPIALPCNRRTLFSVGTLLKSAPGCAVLLLGVEQSPGIWYSSREDEYSQCIFKIATFFFLLLFLTHTGKAELQEHTEMKMPASLFKCKHTKIRSCAPLQYDSIFFCLHCPR